MLKSNKYFLKLISSALILSFITIGSSCKMSQANSPVMNIDAKLTSSPTLPLSPTTIPTSTQIITPTRAVTTKPTSTPTPIATSPVPTLPNDYVEPIDPIIWYADITHDGKPEKIAVDLTYVLNYPKTGKEKTVSVYSGRTGKLIWTAHADTVHVGWNGIYVYNDGKQDFLLIWQPMMYQGSANYTYTILSLNETGKAHVLSSDTLTFDISKVKPYKTDKIKDYLDKVNHYLLNSYVLVDTDDAEAIYSAKGLKKINLFDTSQLLDEIELQQK